MGNYSYFVDQVGCELDISKLNERAKLFLEDYEIEPKDIESLGDTFDGWKIQGYWYDNFINFLYDCARAMKNLTEDKSDNYIEMNEEQGYKFIIHFLLEEGKPKIILGYAPMEWKEEELKEKGD